jgi:predicted transcriptional regulator
MNGVNDKRKNYLEMTVDIILAYVSKNQIDAKELSYLIDTVNNSLSSLGRTEKDTNSPLKPAVNPKRSVHDDYIVCLEDGKKFKLLKRHLASHYNMTPEQYREKWGLPANYPMVAPNYTALRSVVAKKAGLGRKLGAPATPTKRRGRPKTTASDL